MYAGALRIFSDLDPLRERIFEFLYVRNDQNFLKIVLNGVNNLDQLLASLAVLRAKALVQNQRLQPRARPVREQARQGDADGKVDAEGLAAAEELIGARADVIGDLDVQGLYLSAGRFGRARGLKADLHGVVGHAGQQRVGLVLQLRDSVFDDERLHALLAEGPGERLVDTAFLIRLLMRFRPRFSLQRRPVALVNKVFITPGVDPQRRQFPLEASQFGLSDRRAPLDVLVLPQLPAQLLHLLALGGQFRLFCRDDLIQPRFDGGLLLPALLGVGKLLVARMAGFQAANGFAHRLILRLRHPQALDFGLQPLLFGAFRPGEVAALQPGAQGLHQLARLRHIRALGDQRLAPGEKLLIPSALRHQLVAAFAKLPHPGLRLPLRLLRCLAFLFQILKLFAKFCPLLLLPQDDRFMLLAAQVALTDRALRVRARQQFQHLVNLGNIGLEPVVAGLEAGERLLRGL